MGTRSARPGIIAAACAFGDGWRGGDKERKYFAEGLWEFYSGAIRRQVLLPVAWDWSARSDKNACYTIIVLDITGSPETLSA
jgi:hypothetical protein